MRLSTQSLTKKLDKSANTSFVNRWALPPLWILSAASGAVFSLSLAPYGYWVLALISPAILYALLMADISHKRAFVLGHAYGFGFWVVGAFWLYTSIHVYGGTPMPLALFAIGLMATLMGLFHGFLAMIFNRFMGKQPLAFAALWVFFEWVRTWILTGFPWLFVGYAFTEQYWLSSLAPVFGVFAISFVAVLLAASLVEVFRRRAEFLLISSLFVITSLALWLVDPQWTQKKQEDGLKVSLLQGNIPQDLKWLTEYQNKTLEIYAKLTSTEWDQDIIIWPEASIPMFQTQVADFIKQIEGFAYQTETAWITGVPFKDDANFNPSADPYPPFYNSVIALGTDTEGRYNKQRLVPFGEYIPMKGLLNLFPNLSNSSELLDYSRGNSSQELITVRNHKMGTAICYEVAYPETTRKNAIGSEFMLTISNDAWFDGTASPHQHLQMVQMRSLETGRWFLRATNTGITAFINEKGQVVKQLPQLKRDVLRGEVELRQGQTPFVRFGQIPMMTLVSLLLLLSFFGQRAKLKAQYGRDQKTTMDINELNRKIAEADRKKREIIRPVTVKKPVTEQHKLATSKATVNDQIKHQDKNQTVNQVNNETNINNQQALQEVSESSKDKTSKQRKSVTVNKVEINKTEQGQLQKLTNIKSKDTNDDR